MKCRIDFGNGGGGFWRDKSCKYVMLKAIFQHCEESFRKIEVFLCH